MTVYLVGFMGCGKSTVGRALAERMQFDFIDLDVAISEEMGMTINEIFARFGEPKFREVEGRLLKEIDTMQDIVVATGGGAPCFGENMAVMNGRGTTVYLRLTCEGLFGRLKRGKARRPKLAALSKDELVTYIAELMQEREPFYSQAAITVDCDGLMRDDVVELVAKSLEDVNME